MEKLSLYERLLKNKDRLKVQAVSLVLAATAVITTWCGSKETPKPTPEKPGIEEVIDNNKEDKMVELTVENLDSEAEKLTNELTKKGMDTDFESVRSTLLHLNKDSFTDEEYYSLFEPNENEILVVTDFLNAVLGHNVSSLRYGDLSDLIDFKTLCRNENDYKVIEQLDESSSELAKIVAQDSKNINKEIMKSLEPLNGLVTGDGQIKIGSETFDFLDLTNGSKIIVSYFGLSALNYVNYSCESKYLTDDTKEACNYISDNCRILSREPFIQLDENAKASELAKTK